MNEFEEDIFDTDGEDYSFLDESEDDYDTPEDAERKVAEMEEDIQDIQFDHNSDRDEFCEKYEKALRAAGYDEDVIDDKIEDIQNSTMTREDLCDYYGGIDEDELDDVMDDDMRE